MDWRESKIALWTVVARDNERDELLQRAVVLAHAVWDPKSLPKILRKRQRKMTQEEIREALDKAERVSGMRLKEVTLDAMREMRNRGEE